MFSLHPSLYFFLQFLFQLYLMSIPAPDEISIEDPLCNSSLGSMVTLDYVTPLTLCRVVESSCLPAHNIVPHTSLHDQPCHKTMKKYEYVEEKVISLIPRRNPRFEHGSVIVHNIFAYFAFSLSASQVYIIQERCWFSQIDFFVEYFPHRIKILLRSSQFLCRPHTQIRTILFHDERRDIPNLEFSPIHVSIGLSQIAFPIIVLLKDDHIDFVQEERLGLPYWTRFWPFVSW